MASLLSKKSPTNSIIIDIKKDVDMRSFVDSKSLVKHLSTFKYFMHYQSARNQLKQYVKELHKEEQFEFIERIEKELIENRVNTYSSLLNFINILEKDFLTESSNQQVNVKANYIKQLRKLKEDKKQENRDELMQWLVSIYTEILFQLKYEVFKAFKRTEEFQLWVLDKIIAFSTFQEKVLNASISVSEFLEVNELCEYVKLFKKKKLIELWQLKGYDQNQFKELGITKIGHQKKLARIVKQYFTALEEYVAPSNAVTCQKTN
ncbi:hypothetical protein ABK040_008450 [Willaertia magna]